jgi:hypothetical protein
MKIFQMLLPATCACPQTARWRASGVLRLHKILFTVQVEWRIVKLFDRAYNTITLYYLEAFLAVFRIISGDFSVARRFVSPLFPLPFLAYSPSAAGCNPALSQRNQFTMVSAQPFEVLHWWALPLGWCSLPPFTCDTLARNSCSSLS